MILRVEGGLPPMYTTGDDNYFTRNIQYGGNFTTAGAYEGGSVCRYDFCSSSTFSFVELNDIIDGFGLTGGMKCYYRDPILGLKNVETSIDLNQICKCKTPNKVIEMYVEQVQDSDDVIQPSGDDSDYECPEGDDSDEFEFVDSDYEDEGACGNDDILCEQNNESVLRNMVNDSVSNEFRPRQLNIEDVDSDDCQDPDQLEEMYESDVEDTSRFLEFNVETDMKDPQFEVGMIFRDAKEFRAAVREYAIKNGKKEETSMCVI